MRDSELFKHIPALLFGRRASTLYFTPAAVLAAIAETRDRRTDAIIGSPPFHDKRGKS